MEKMMKSGGCTNNFAANCILAQDLQDLKALSDFNLKFFTKIFWKLDRQLENSDTVPVEPLGHWLDVCLGSLAC